jgi:hypothetical protein
MRTDRLAKLISDWEPQIAEAFLAAVREITNEVRFSDLVAAIKAGDVEGAIRLVGLDPLQFRALDRAIEQAFEEAGVQTMQGMRGPLGLRLAPRFDFRAPDAQAWLRSHATELIRQITDDQRVLIRQALAPLRSPLDPMITGDTPQKLALDLVGRVNRATNAREGGILGLTSQQARWAANYAREVANADPAALTRLLRDRRYDATIRKAIRTGQPIAKDLQERMVEAYRSRALRRRAETIALNEAGEVLHRAQQEAWDQVIARGVVAETRVRRFWITVGDDRVRPTHAAVPGMNKKGVGLKQPFQTPKGPALNPGWSFDPGCRCRVRIRLAE